MSYDFSNYPNGLKTPKHAYVDMAGDVTEIVNDRGDTKSTKKLIRLNVDAIWGRLDTITEYMNKGWRVLGFGKLDMTNIEHQKIANFIQQVTGAVKEAVAEATAMQAKVAAQKAKQSGDANPNGGAKQ